MSLSFTYANRTVFDILGDSIIDARGRNVPLKTVIHAFKVVGLYFSTTGSESCRLYTSKLVEFYRTYNKNNLKNPFGVILLAADRNSGNLRDCLGLMPWLALHPMEKERQRAIQEKFSVTKVPSLVLVDGITGETICEDAKDKIIDDPNGNEFPWKPKRVKTILETAKICQTFKCDEVAVPFSAITGKIVCLFFSAHFYKCPPSHEFTPLVHTMYSDLKLRGENFELIFVSTDDDQCQFEEYISGMTWFYIKYADIESRMNLKASLAITECPRLIVLNEKFDVITSEGGLHLREDPTCKDFPWPPKPVHELTSKHLSKLTKKRFLLYVTDGSSAQLKEAETSLYGVALKYHEKGEKQDLFFFYSGKVENGSLVRVICDQFHIDMNAIPLVAIIDPQSKQASVLNDKVTKYTIRDFVEKHERQMFPPK
ncbi:nucleoredoxin-like [Tubulanus polymorphus]|uniref:nucleoredoxin-like n=1 Tax=Tubulanus polymorphus TaxID=672921 RepID=UPI003DA621A0